MLRFLSTEKGIVVARLKEIGETLSAAHRALTPPTALTAHLNPPNVHLVPKYARKAHWKVFQDAMKARSLLPYGTLKGSSIFDDVLQGKEMASSDGPRNPHCMNTPEIDSKIGKIFDYCVRHTSRVIDRFKRQQLLRKASETPTGNGMIQVNDLSLFAISKQEKRVVEQIQARARLMYGLPDLVPNEVKPEQNVFGKRYVGGYHLKAWEAPGLASEGYDPVMGHKVRLEDESDKTWSATQ